MHIIDILSINWGNEIQRIRYIFKQWIEEEQSAMSLKKDHRITKNGAKVIIRVIARGELLQPEPLPGQIGLPISDKWRVHEAPRAPGYTQCGG